MPQKFHWYVWKEASRKGMKKAQDSSSTEIVFENLSLQTILLRLKHLKWRIYVSVQPEEPIVMTSDGCTQTDEVSDAEITTTDELLQLYQQSRIICMCEGKMTPSFIPWLFDIKTFLVM